jgi:hypothetical protein
VTAIVSEIGRFWVAIDADTVADVDEASGDLGEALDAALWLGETTDGVRMRAHLTTSTGAHDVILGARVEVVDIVCKPIPEPAARFTAARGLDTLFERDGGFGYVLAVDRALSFSRS